MLKVAALLGHVGIESLVRPLLKRLGYDHDVYVYGSNYLSFKEDWVRRISNPSNISPEEESKLLVKISERIGLDHTKYDAFLVDMHDFVWGAFISTGKRVVSYPCIMSHQWQDSQVRYWKSLNLHKASFRYVVNDVSYMAGFHKIYPEMNYLLIENAIDPDMEVHTGVNSSVLTVLGAAKSRVHAAGITWAEFKGIVGELSHKIVGPANENVGGGCVTKEDLLTLYRDSRVCLNVFGSDITIGLPEILMSGIPLVTINTGQASKYLTDGVNAIISKDLSYLKAALSKLYNNNDYAVIIGKAGREVALKHFNLLDKIPLWRKAFEE